MAALPVYTTLLSILRPDASADDYDDDSGPEIVQTDIRGNIGIRRGLGTEVGGQFSVVEYRLQCDVCDLRHTDVVMDQGDGSYYSVIWLVRRRGLGLDHLDGGLQRALGAA